MYFNEDNRNATVAMAAGFPCCSERVRSDLLAYPSPVHSQLIKGAAIVSLFAFQNPES